MLMMLFFHVSLLFFFFCSGGKQGNDWCCLHQLFGKGVMLFPAIVLDVFV